MGVTHDRERLGTAIDEAVELRARGEENLTTRIRHLLEKGRDDSESSGFVVFDPKLLGLHAAQTMNGTFHVVPPFPGASDTDAAPEGAGTVALYQRVATELAVVLVHIRIAAVAGVLVLTEAEGDPLGVPTPVPRLQAVKIDVGLSAVLGPIGDLDHLHLRVQPTVELQHTLVAVTVPTEDDGPGEDLETVGLPAIVPVDDLVGVDTHCGQCREDQTEHDTEDTENDSHEWLLSGFERYTVLGALLPAISS